MLAEYLKNVDMDKVASLVAEQVKLVGGKTTYDVRFMKRVGKKNIY